MTTQHVSPYTGRPVIEWQDEIELHDHEGGAIGNVVEVNPDFVVVYANTGFLGLGEPKIYFIPRKYVAEREADDWYLTVDKDQFAAMGWNELPVGSPWNDEWADSGSAYLSRPWRGQTRFRRYDTTDTTGTTSDR